MEQSNDIRINIDGKPISARSGQTILEAARDHGLYIPTLCEDERVRIYGACGVCVVTVAGLPRPVRACGTLVRDGMSIETNGAAAAVVRRCALELLLSDHTGDCRPPCSLACPAETDCQGYVGLIANGLYDEAIELLREKIPFPASIGRVCPHPCETACRRELAGEAIAIADLKRFVGDLALSREDAPPEVTENGRKIAVIGGGPGGLSAAYYLRLRGYAVTVYDAMPEMGGMLRYGIPEYRLPKEILGLETARIEKTGVRFENNVKIGREITLSDLREGNDAVVVAVGAWKSVALGVKGEGLGGVYGGIDFLRDAQANRDAFAKKRIAVVGGGNTAMDCCRTAVRLGAKSVYNIYRRTKAEMPAEESEIKEAEEEGVIFRNLTNPIEIIGRRGRAHRLRLQLMSLGEADESGRRAPVPLQGEEEDLPVDIVIIAVGQGLDFTGLEEIERNRRGNIKADEALFTTNLPGVFAIGDASNKGADIAISAIGEGKRLVGIIEDYLNGELLAPSERYLVKKDVTAADFEDTPRLSRIQMKKRAAKTRRADFGEVSLGFSEEAAKNEASRCMECGCLDYFDCKLIKQANEAGVRPEKYKGEKSRGHVADEHPRIKRNPEKCILCGLCVRVCEEVKGMSAFGLSGRGFDTSVRTAFDAPLSESGCDFCGLCAEVCPTGALMAASKLAKPVPLERVRKEGSGLA